METQKEGFEVDPDDIERDVRKYSFLYLYYLTFIFLFTFPQDNIFCAICLDPTVYVDNEIILCDSCDVPVHQLCYSVPEVPEGSWYEALRSIMPFHWNNFKFTAYTV
jgi:hypothetical protein